MGALALFLALGSSVVWGIADFSGGSLTRRAAGVRRHDPVAGRRVRRALVASSACAAHWTGARSRSASLSGIGGGVGLAAFYKALSLGTMSVVSPIAACGAVVPFGNLARDGRATLADRGRRRRAPRSSVQCSRRSRSGGPRRRSAAAQSCSRSWRRSRSGCSSTSSASAAASGDAGSALFGARVGSLAAARRDRPRLCERRCGSRGRRSPRSRRSGWRTSRRTRSSRSPAGTACSRSLRCSVRCIRS